MCATRKTNVRQNAPIPAGRNANGCSQKINKMKTTLRADIDALKAGEPIAASS
jgi:hypothetical protein